MGRTRRISQEELEAWLEPTWLHAVRFFEVEGLARYEWYQGSAYGRCTLWDPGRIVLSRPHFRRFLLADDRHFAAQVVVHEILHGLGINHDGRIGWSLAKDYPLDRELVDHIFQGKDPTHHVALMLSRVRRAWQRRDRLFCPGTLRAHPRRHGGAFCAMCGLLVEDVSYEVGTARATKSLSSVTMPGP